MKKHIIYTILFTLLCYNVISQNLTLGLVAHWPLDSNVNDMSGNLFHGTQMNNPLTTSGVNNIPNTAYSFNGINQFVRFGDILDSVFSKQPNAQFSISFWVNPSAFPSSPFRSVIIGKSGGGSGPYQWYILLDPDYKFTAAASSSEMGPINWVEHKSSDSAKLNTWQHVVMVFDGEESVFTDRIKIYVDKISGGLGPINAVMGTSTVDTDQEITIGSGHAINDPTTPNNLFNGAIDEIKIYSRVLDSLDVLALYNYKNQTTGLTRSIPSTHFTIFPNPSSNYIKVKSTAITNSYIIRIYSVEGKLLESLSSNEKETTILLDKFASGVYFIEVEDYQSNTISQNKIFIQK